MRLPSDARLTAEYKTRWGKGTGKPLRPDQIRLELTPCRDANDIPVCWATVGANRHDSILFAPPLRLSETVVCYPT